MQIQELVNVGGKTTMRIGGQARYYGDMQVTGDAEEAVAFAKEKKIPLIILGNGANTVFADGVIEALVVRIKNDSVVILDHERTDMCTVTVSGGKNLPMLINELAAKGWDMSPLTGIPGTLGGAIVGNAGQGAGGIWLDRYVRDVTVYTEGTWRKFSKQECWFEYRESVFKHLKEPAIIWEATLEVPAGDPGAIKAEIERLLQKRIETQPHLKTAGSCFKTVGDTPAWKLVDAAGLRGFKVGDVEVAEKHANFLLNKGKATYDDAKKIVEEIRKKVPVHLEVEMRFVEPDGSLAF